MKYWINLKSCVIKGFIKLRILPVVILSLLLKLLSLTNINKILQPQMKSSIKDKQNRKSLEPRWSLKPQNIPNKLEGRMSMLPLRKSTRQSFCTINSNIDAQFKSIKNLRTSMTPLTQQRPSLLNNTTHLNNSSYNQNCRKEVIINNLVNKLDQQEEIRSIIQQKLRNNNYHSKKSCNSHANQNNLFTSQFQPYSSNSSHFGQTFTSFNSNQLNENQSNSTLVTKLRKCQQEIQYFKEVVQNMAEKIKLLTKQNKNEYQEDENTFKKNKNRERESFTNKKRVKQVCTQTEWNAVQDNHKQDGPFDFLDNLDRTLKILNSNKKIR